MLVNTANGKIRIADKPFAKGGEGGVYDVVGRADLVAKIYHPSRRSWQQENKISAMLSNPPRGAAKSQIAWPVGMIKGQKNEFIGFLMPRIRNAKKIDQLYSFDKRSRHPWGFYIKVAKNLCAAVDAVHKSGHICGDLNPANICVEESSGLITLVDTDSYHIISAEGRVYRCSVCMPAYVPAELHIKMRQSGFDLRTTSQTTFTHETDLFALAVHIFALLMNGCHPYACTVPEGVSDSSFSLLQNIANGCFPFVKSADRIGVPKYAPYLVILPNKLRKLIIKAFARTQGAFNPKQRPQAAEWYAALSELEQELKTCYSKPNHVCWSGCKECPWCAIERKMSALIISNRNKRVTTSVKRIEPESILTSSSSRNSIPQKPTSASYAFWTGRIGTVIISILAVAAWGGFNLGAQWGLNTILPMNVWWQWAIRWLAFGIVPFLPAWIFALIGCLSLPLDYVADGIADTLFTINIYITVLAYTAAAIYTSYSSGVLEILFLAGFLCAPPLLLFKLFPDFVSYG